MRPAGRAFLMAALMAVVGPPGAAGQERCALRISARSANSVGTAGGEGAYTTYLGGGTVTLRCGGAVMTGDSAVHYESEQRAEMIGGVDYRDTTRTLTADRLTYYEPNGQVVAQGDVELVRLATRATLSGPRVSFYRAGAGGGVGRTLATGRPHMVMPPEGGTGPPIEVDADEAEFLGDTVALARGDVTIRRPDFDATADSARFARETGRLFGRPVVTARGMRLEGDSIHAGLASAGVDRLHAFGAARGESESVELEAEEILILTSSAEDEVERIEAFGDRALAAAQAFLIAGDSLDIRFAAGRIDSVTATGAARSFQLEGADDSGHAGAQEDEQQVGQERTDTPLMEPETGLSDEANWIEGDTIRAWFEASPGGRADPSAAAVGEDSARIRRLLARGAARSYFAAVRDTARSERASRNYIIGERIDIQFADGEPAEVTADQAIGVFLEPSDGTPSGAVPSAVRPTGNGGGP